MFDDPKTRQDQTGEDMDQGSAGGQAYQDTGDMGNTQDDLNQDTNTDDMNEE